MTGKLISEETAKLLEEMEKFSRQVTSTPDKSKRFLVKAGICTDRGNLKLAYR
jgi:hypothetical protein